jgi:hypothetical protein
MQEREVLTSTTKYNGRFEAIHDQPRDVVDVIKNI